MKNGQVKVSHSKAKADSRAQIKRAPAPQGGFLTNAVEKAIAAGPAGIRQAQRVALRHFRKYEEKAVDRWRKETDFLKKWGDSGDHFNRARDLLLYGARDSWRPCR